MFRPDARIVETCRERMRLGDLAVLVLQQIGLVAVEHARTPARKACRMLSGFKPVASRFHAHHAHSGVIQKGVEHADGVRSAAHAGDQHVRSEEHTSELQSLMRNSYAVFCLKKKQYTNKNI